MDSKFRTRNAVCWLMQDSVPAKDAGKRRWWRGCHRDVRRASILAGPASGRRYAHKLLSIQTLREPDEELPLVIASRDDDMDYLTVGRSILIITGIVTLVWWR